MAYKYQNAIIVTHKRKFPFYRAQVSIIATEVKFQELLNNTYFCIVCKEHFLLLIRFKHGDIAELVAYVQLKKKNFKTIVKLHRTN